jgi:O-antigen ligase
LKITLSTGMCSGTIFVLILLLMFFMPLSPVICSILVTMLIGAILLHPVYRQYVLSQYLTLWGMSSLALFLFIMIAGLWSEAPLLLQSEVIGKYCKLAYFPILALGFIPQKTRYWALNSYLASIILTCIVSILKGYGVLQIGIVNDLGDLFYNHIMTGFMVAFACYLSALFIFQHSNWQRYLYLFVFILCSYQLIFINNSRTGYLAYFLLMIFFIGQKLSLKQALCGIFLFSSIYSLGYFASPIMQSSVNRLLNDVVMFKQNQKNTSLGFRIQFHHYARYLFLEHPVIGQGTGAFKYHFYEDNPIPEWGRDLTDPHSQYWMFLAEQGIVGFTLFLIFLGCLFITTMMLRETRPIMLGLLIAFGVGCLSDSILSYSIVGQLLILVSALCVGELLSKRVKLVENYNQFLNHADLPLQERSIV